MRIILLILSVLSFSLIHAQPGGGGQGGRSMGGQNRVGGHQQQREEMPEFNASKAAGVFNYDIDEAVKKVKLKTKKHEDLILDTRKAITKYNNAINEIALLNKDNFDTLNVYMNSIMKSLRASRGEQTSGDNDRTQQRGNRGAMMKIRKIVNKKIEPVKAAIKDEEIQLNANLKQIFDEKQYNLWLKYQEKIKKDLMPKPRENNNGGMQNRSRGQGNRPNGGMGMR
ncbi:hypothetical protein [Algibacter aquimarinus]|uniref:DUF4168 domain-containing protein n=1 Tax=Algibacter aquimarinus TaxID=1136748 RepID=A0ABP9HMY9_9FLAO